MSRTRRIALLSAVLTLTSLSSARMAAAQMGPPPDNGGMFGGPGGDMGGGPPGGMGGPGNPAQMQQRLIRDIERQLDADPATFDAMLPDIQKIVQLKAALDSNGRPNPGRRGGNDTGGPPDMNGGPGGPPDMNGGGNQNATADQNGGGGGDNGNGGNGPRHRRRRQQAQQADGGPDQASAQVAQDATAADLTEKVRALRASLQPTDDNNGPAADVSGQLAAVRAARSKATDELGTTRKHLKGLVKSAHQEAVFVATGVLE